MTEQWVVLLRTGSPEEIVAYGPMDAETAGEFARFLTAEVDPATVRRLRSPTRELLGYWQSKCTCVETWVPNTDVIELAPGATPCPAHPRPDLERSQ